MRFTLTYDGPLLGRSAKPDHMQQIRDDLHPQMAELWQHEPLIHRPEWLLPNRDQSALLERLDSHGQPHSFVALVHDSLKLTAELDILLLRPQRPGGILYAGDLDNRLKTLLDSLSAPSHQDQVVAGRYPATAATPLFTLLEDDKLVTRVNLDTDQLLGRRVPNEVRAIIRVTVRARPLTMGTMGIIG